MSIDSTSAKLIAHFPLKQTLVYSLLTAAVYFLSAKLVFSFSLVESESIFAIWPPTGVALVFLLFRGYRVAPGIFLGALWLNLSLGSSLPIAFGIALGNTLGPVVVYGLIQHFLTKSILKDTQTLIHFILFCFLGSIITSSWGTSMLFLGGLLAPDDRLLGWLVWLFGDLIGFLLVTSVYLSFKLEKKYLKGQEDSKLELVLMVLLMLGLSAVIFGSGYFFATNYPIEYLVLFPLMWASIRFKPNVVIMFLFLLSALAIIGTGLGFSSFSMDEKRLSLILLQFFIFTVSLVVLMLTAQKYQMLTALYEKEQLSIFDFLTKTYNRRYFMQAIEKEIYLLERYNRPFSIVMFDADFFKKINDEFGHFNGDKVLIELTSLVKNQIRKSDLLARIGGEEFMVLLPETSLAEALRMTEKLRATIEQHTFPIDSRVTCSFGVIECVDAEVEIESVLKRVDEKLYQAKNSGRNCVIS